MFAPDKSDIFEQGIFNGKEATVNIVLDSSTCPGYKLVHFVFGKINYGGLKHNSLYLGLVLPSGG
jgi:hypothetical protein